MKNNKQSAVRFAILEAIYWCIFASYGSYITAFGLSRGYPQSMVSIMVAGYMVCAFMGQFFWGSVCDKLRTNKKVFILGIVLGGLVQLGMYFFDSPIIFGILYGTFGFLMGPMGAILETWLLKSIHYDVSLYGKSRSMGSAGYAVCILIMGRLITRFGFFIMPIISSGIILITLLIALRTDDSPVDNTSTVSKQKITTKDILSILKIPDYLLVLVMMLGIGLCISPVNNLKIMVLQDVGGDVSTQGVDSFCGCIAQFAMFFMSGVLTRIPPKIRMIICSVITFIALFIDYNATSPWMVICATVMLFGSYSVIFPAAREVVMTTVKYEYQTTANGLVDAIYGSLAGTIALMFAGSIAEAYSVKFMIMITLCMSVVPIIIMIVVLARDSKSRRNCACEVQYK
ncbi:MAG: MFS transporter [Lachnospiraceae bacterium]|nr:MFS transporter [Lachnospiraceae bacterium]